MRFIFSICVMIAYALAASTTFVETFSIVFNTQITISITAAMPIFIICLGFITIGAHSYMRGILSFLTSIKVLFLIVIISAVGYLSGRLDQTYSDQWAYFMRPFLIGTTTLGNALAVLPMLYGKMKPTRGNLESLRAGSIFGLAVTWLISILWTYFILKCVPQYAAPARPSLLNAEMNGELATIPLVKIIQSREPELMWIAVAMTIFIVYSLSVSFLTVGSALKQQVDGYIKWFQREMHREGSYLNIVTRNIPLMTYIVEFLAYSINYVVVLVVAITNGKAMFLVLEGFVSLCLNMVSGVFMSIIVRFS